MTIVFGFPEEKVFLLLVHNGIKNLFTFSEHQDYYKITTPFLFPDNEYLDLYYDPKTKVLSDLGAVVNWVGLHGCDSFSSQTKNIDRICQSLNITLKNGELATVVAEKKEIGVAIINLGQGIVRICDLFARC